MHDWTQFAIAILQLIGGGAMSILGGLILRSVRRQENLVAIVERHGREIRETRMAISYVAGKLGMEPLDYNDG